MSVSNYQLSTYQFLSWLSNADITTAVSSYRDHLYKNQVLNPIPTGCCHMILINGLIPPNAGRNRVNLPKFKNH